MISWASAQKVPFRNPIHLSQNMSPAQRYNVYSYNVTKPIHDPFIACGSSSSLFVIFSCIKIADSGSAIFTDEYFGLDQRKVTRMD